MKIDYNIRLVDVCIQVAGLTEGSGAVQPGRRICTHMKSVVIPAITLALRIVGRRIRLFSIIMDEYVRQLNTFD